MFDLQVLGLSEAEVSISRNWPTCIVSAITLNQPFEKRGDHHLIIEVEDVHVKERRHATKEMMEAIFEHTKGLTSHDRLLVHCFAGQSRSTAVAIGILIQHGLTAQEAFDEVARVRPMLIPNQLITSLVDAHFKLGGALDKIVGAHIVSALRAPQRTEKVTGAQSAAMKKIMDLFSDD